MDYFEEQYQSTYWEENEEQYLYQKFIQEEQELEEEELSND